MVMPNKAPSNFVQLSEWLEDRLTKITVAKQFKALLDPRKLLGVLQFVLKAVVEQDFMVNGTYLELYRSLGLRQEVTADGVDSLARQVLIEARLRARELRVDEAVQRNTTAQAKIGAGDASLESGVGAAMNAKQKP